MLKYFATATALIFSSALAAAEIVPINIVEQVQNDVNSSIKYKFEKPGSDFWKIPTTTGDCEDFALLKRQMLIDAGWNEDDLEIILLIGTDVVKNANIGHVVLRIKSLDMILDMPELKNPEKVIAPAVQSTYYAKEDYRFLCKIKDISAKRYTNVSDRCDKTSFLR